MKMVVAVIKPFKLDDVREALSEAGVNGITVTEVKASGARRATPSSIAAPSMSSIPAQDQARGRGRRRPGRTRGRGHPECRQSGKIGDGKIFVTPLEQVIRIRTGELDNDAL